MPSLDGHNCGEFVTMDVNNKASYATTIALKEKKVTTNFAQQINELFCHENFALQKFQLNILQAPPILLYQKLPLPLDFSIIGFIFRQK